MNNSKFRSMFVSQIFRSDEFPASRDNQEFGDFTKAFGNPSSGNQTTSDEFADFNNAFTSSNNSCNFLFDFFLYFEFFISTYSHYQLIFQLQTFNQYHQLTF